MPKAVKILLIVFAVLLVTGGAAAFYLYGYHFPYENAASGMPEETDIVFRQQEDGSVVISWPKAKRADKYLFELLRKTDQLPPGGETGPVYETVYSRYIDEGTEHTMEYLPDDEELTLRIQTVVYYSFPFDEEPRMRLGERAMQVTGTFAAPAISQLTWEADAATKQLRIRFSMPENGTAGLYHLDGDVPVRMKQLTEGNFVMEFGDGKNFPMPPFDKTHTFALDLVCRYEGYTFYGIITDSFSVVREDLLGTELELTTEDLGNNQFRFSWNETKGEHYEFQLYNPSRKSWNTVLTVPRDGERVFTTEHLDRYSTFTYRVIALGGQTLPDSEYSATPDESTVQTHASVVYSMIWPIQKLNIYSDTAKTQVVGTAPAAECYCVLDYRDGMFKIRYDKKAYGYIDANYCMINLPDMIGDLCLYDITNSYASIYMAHEYEIPTITGQITIGYEKVMINEGNYLVPLLFPTAHKLEKAAFAAVEKGFKLKIYDSFRPQKATRMLYDTTESYANSPIPEVQYTDKVLTDMPVLEEGQQLTYLQLMTDNNRYTLNYFLAKGGSRHNQGIALDLTMVNIKTGEEVLMQTSIHDLTWYSERKRNNYDANRLSKFMTDAGFGTLTSEWWHFQDNEAKDSLKPAYLGEGVDPGRWARDDTGWRYYLDNGKRYYYCTKKIDGVTYIFDQQGYIVDELGNRLQDV